VFGALGVVSPLQAGDSLGVPSSKPISTSERRSTWDTSNRKARDITSPAEATGIPVYPDGETTLPGTSIVKAQDPAGVEIIVSRENDDI
jgi:hypothetical protein